MSVYMYEKVCLKVFIIPSCIARVIIHVNKTPLNVLTETIVAPISLHLLRKAILLQETSFNFILLLFLETSYYFFAFEFNLLIRVSLSLNVLFLFKQLLNANL